MEMEFIGEMASIPPQKLRISLNNEKLSTLIRGHLSEFFNKTLTADIIDSVTLNLIEEFERFLNTES